MPRAADSLYPATQGFVTVHHHRLFYRSLGHALRGTVLVVHGGPSEHLYLSCLADLVPPGYRVVWYDQWGCGRSDRPRSFEGYTVESASADIPAVARALRLGTPHLFGHSWGGALALEAVTRFPDRFRTLMVCGGFASELSFRQAMRRHVRSLPAVIRTPIERGERDREFQRPAYRAAVRRRRREFSIGMKVLPLDLVASEPGLNHRLLDWVYGDRPGLFSPATGVLQGWDVRPALERLRLSTLVVAGEREAGRYTAREIHRRVRGSRLAIIAGAAHHPLLEQRDRTMQVLLSFLGAHSPPAGTGRSGRT